MVKYSRTGIHISLSAVECIEKQRVGWPPEARGKRNKRLEWERRATLSGGRSPRGFVVMVTGNQLREARGARRAQRMSRGPQSRQVRRPDGCLGPFSEFLFLRFPHNASSRFSIPACNEPLTALTPGPGGWIVDGFAIIGLWIDKFNFSVTHS